ncbi:MAG: hypothetical protein ABIP97_10510 [Chthoniobacterales bacterium]
MIKVYLGQIPAEGLHLEGEEDPANLDLNDLNLRILGPLKYSLDVGLSEGGIFATGELSLKVELKCVATLEDFPYDITVNDFATQIECEGREVVDLTPVIREDILLSLPSYPRIDREGAQIIPRIRQEGNEAPPGVLKSGSPAWDELNKLNIKK